MPSEAPPSSAELTTSLTWRDSVEVKTFTSSGMIAPASVPQEMIVASFHHCVESPPSVGIISDEIHVGEGDGDDRGDPDQRSERSFVVHLVGVAVLGFGDDAVDEVGGGAGDEHDDAHDEDPDEELDLDRGALHAEKNEGDQRDAGDAVGLEAVGAGADRVAGVVAGAVGDDAGVAGVVFLDLEDDLHQVGADVGDLGEDAAAMRSAAAPRDSPMAKPMKQGPA